MAEVSQVKLDIWMYRFLLGTLSKTKTWLLKKELERKDAKNDIKSALERKLLAAFTVHGVSSSTRIYLAELLKDWEKRS